MFLLEERPTGGSLEYRSGEENSWLGRRLDCRKAGESADSPWVGPERSGLGRCGEVTPRLAWGSYCECLLIASTTGWVGLLGKYWLAR